MRQKLTLVVTCTDRKSARPQPDLQLRNLPAGTVHERATNWISRVSETADRAPLRNLYQGEAWTQVGRLAAAAERAGFEPDVVVVSAGLGLRHLDSIAPAYSATFSPNLPDTVASDRSGTQAWWRALSRSTSSLDVNSAFDGPTLFALSNTYASAILPDLLRLSDREDVLVFGGSADVPPHQRVPANRSLRSHLGGTLTSLNLRMATAWLDQLTSARLTDGATRANWSKWAETVQAVEVFDRQPLTDQALLEWIRESLERQPTLTKTRALRELRDAGVACEQRRFGRLFASLAEAT